MTDDMPTDYELVEDGFMFGYLRVIQAQGADAHIHPPDCPFPLRSRERELWLKAHAAGCVYARQQTRDMQKHLRGMWLRLSKTAS